MIVWKSYVWLGRRESIYNSVSVAARLIVSMELLSLYSSTSAGKDILVVFNFIHASVQLASSRLKVTCG
jgi:hypothetical protein